MFISIISLLLSVVCFVFLGIKFEKVQRGYGTELTKTFKLNKKQILAVIPLLLILLNFRAVVPANHVGILYSPFSGVREETIGEGWASKGFFDRVYTINTQVQSTTLEGVTGQTKDAQWVSMNINIKYKVDPTTAFQVFKQYKNLENVNTHLIPPLVQRSIESITTQYDVMELLGSKRNEIYVGIEKELKARLISYGITFDSINFNDTDAGDKIEQAIADEAVAKKAVEKAEQDRLKKEIEAQNRVVEARAEKEKALIEAETKSIKAKSEADANNLLSQSITPELLSKMEMEARLKHGWVTIQTGNVIADIGK